MGEAELKTSSHEIIIHSDFIFYGDAASAELAESIAEDIAVHWNEPKATVKIRGEQYRVIFHITGITDRGLQPETVWYNILPRNNYFRIEEFSIHDISFADGLKSNTGYFKRDNLLHNSTTAAHEYGHTLGLEHPRNLDIRGQGLPGIMYPRGTLCDPEFQYDPAAVALQPGGTMNPYKRKVLQSDIDNLKLHRLAFNRRGFAIIGDFSSLFHEKHLL
jgi:hypothetical protein